MAIPFPGELDPGPPSLDGAFRKLRRAEFHRDCLDAQFAAFIDEKVDRMVFQTNPERTLVEVSGPPIEDIADQAWPLIIGDCIQNARIALEFAVAELQRLPPLTKKQTSTLKKRGNGTRQYFPVCAESEDWKDRVNGRGYLDGVNVEDVAIIEKVQPYNGGNLGGVDATILTLLAERSDTDKHRLLLTTSARAEIEHYRVHLGPGMGYGVGSGIVQLAFLSGPGPRGIPVSGIDLQEKIWRREAIGLPFDPRAYAKTKISFLIHFPDSELADPVNEILWQICAAVGYILNALKPSFARS